MAISTVGSSPIYPCAIGASMVNAIGLVRSLDWCTVVVVCAGADFATHAIGVTKLGVRSHACTMLASSTGRFHEKKSSDLPLCVPLNRMLAIPS